MLRKHWLQLQDVKYEKIEAKESHSAAISWLRCAIACETWGLH